MEYQGALYRDILKTKINRKKKSIKNHEEK